MNTPTSDDRLKQLLDGIRQFVRERDWEQFHTPKNLAMALSVEVAEIVEHLQWLPPEESDNLPPDTVQNVREEIGDLSLLEARSRHG